MSLKAIKAKHLALKNNPPNPHPCLCQDVGYLLTLCEEAREIIVPFSEHELDCPCEVTKANGRYCTCGKTKREEWLAKVKK